MLDAISQQTLLGRVGIYEGCLTPMVANTHVVTILYIMYDTIIHYVNTCACLEEDISWVKVYGTNMVVYPQVHLLQCYVTHWY